jgi:hypothetical protein
VLPLNPSSSSTSGDEHASPNCPIGCKRAKAKQAAEIAAANNAETFQKMAVAYSNIADAAKKQTAFLECQQAAMTRMADEAIMCKDLTGVSNQFRQYYECEQSKILARIAKEDEASTRGNI